MQYFKFKTNICFLLILCLILFRVAYFIKSMPKPTPALSTITVKLEPVQFQDLPHWQAAGLDQTLKTFQISCKWVLKKSPEAAVGNDVIPMKAADWFNVCKKAMHLKGASPEEIKHFFEQAFIPMQWDDKKEKGLFTGYFSPLYDGSLKRDETHQVPIYGVPSDMVTLQLKKFDVTLPERRLIGHVVNHHLEPYFTRQDINHGAILNKAPILAWLKSEVDRLFLEIQGAGTIKLLDGKTFTLGYAGENGAPYRSVAQVLINRGVMTKDSASMQAIRRYVEAHPKEGLTALNENASFVFFNVLSKSYTPGTQGIPLTPGYSLAVDRKWVPLGVPLWLNTERPNGLDTQNPVPLTRLMVAQDTGGAIRGKVRGDVFWGSGKEAGEIAGGMKYKGKYWLLLPRGWVERNYEI